MPSSPPATSVLTVFLTALKLGCVSFGGPVAHLGFFQEEYVRKRRWITESEYADLVALCQFLPGPASSQVGFAIGLKQAGIAGAFAAWLGFTLPSAAIMIVLGLGLGLLDLGHDAGWLAGLKLAAVAVVANAIWSMAAKLCPDSTRAGLALVAAALLTVAPDAAWQVVAILGGALFGWIRFRTQADVNPAAAASEPERVGWPWLMLFGILLLALPIIGARMPGSTYDIIASYYHAGSLVFGGGHVVLPLLDAYFVNPGWIDRDSFLAGYGAAQALPGPLFAFSAYLGTITAIGPAGAAGGVIALVSIYIPSWLLILGAVPYWSRIRRQPAAQAALMGANAAVVGLLLAAFFDPVWTAAVTNPARLAFALLAFAALRFTRLPVWALVAGCAGAGAVLL